MKNRIDYRNFLFRLPSCLIDMTTILIRAEKILWQSEEAIQSAVNVKLPRAYGRSVGKVERRLPGNHGNISIIERGAVARTDLSIIPVLHHPGQHARDLARPTSLPRAEQPHSLLFSIHEIFFFFSYFHPPSLNSIRR